MKSLVIQTLVVAALLAAAHPCASQAMPGATAETLSGKRIVLADAVKGHEAVLVAGFSHEGGMKSGEWVKALHADAAFAGLDVYEIAMLEKAPGMIRGMIKSGMRKGMSDAEQDRTVVVTQDQNLWEKYFGVSDDKEPYIVLLNAKGDVVWHGHGAAANLEPKLRDAMKQQAGN